MTGDACVTRKLRFLSRHAAATSRSARRNKGHRMRAYLCPHCHGWHLTSSPYTPERYQ